MGGVDTSLVDWECRERDWDCCGEDCEREYLRHGRGGDLGPAKAVRDDGESEDMSSSGVVLATKDHGGGGGG